FGAILADPTRVNVDHGSVAAELAGDGRDQFRGAYGRGVNTDFFRPRLDQVRRVFPGADAAADRARHEPFFGNLQDDVDKDLAALVTGADIEEDQLVRPLIFVAAAHLHRVAGIAELTKIPSLQQPAAIHVQTGNDALGQRHVRLLCAAK